MDPRTLFDIGPKLTSSYDLSKSVKYLLLRKRTAAPEMPLRQKSSTSRGRCAIYSYPSKAACEARSSERPRTSSYYSTELTCCR